MSQTITEFTREYPSIAELTETERHELLMDERRRQVLSILAGYTTSIELSQLAEEIATRDERCDPDDEESMNRIRFSLHHMHLPKMEALDVVEYDVDTKRIQI